MPRDAARLKEIQLWVSEDSGFHWEPKSKTTPDLGKFTFRTSHDGEFWFATRTLTVEDAYSPPMNQTVEPSMKVVVDTIPPSILLDPDGRRGSPASVRWEVKDEHLDLKTLLLEYQVDGARNGGGCRSAARHCWAPSGGTPEPPIRSGFVPPSPTRRVTWRTPRS